MMEESRRSSLTSVDLMASQESSSARGSHRSARNDPAASDQPSRGCLSSLLRCLTCVSDDHDDNRNRSSTVASERLNSNHVSTEGVSLPDMSLSFYDDENGEMSESAQEAELRHQFDNENGEYLGEEQISIDLDDDIRAYGRAIADYESLEENCLSEIGQELAAVLTDLRRDPNSFASSSNPKIQALARTRASVFSSRKKLGISQDLNYDSSGRKRANSFSANSSLLTEDDDTLQTDRPARMSKRASWQVGSSSSGLAKRAEAKGLSEPDVTELPDTDPSLSKKLSTRWAERLVDVNPTRGKLKESGVNEHGVQTFKIRPLWPDWLVDTSYSVVKKNKYGKRQKRIIRLTEHHFFNVKNGREITQSFVYSEINKTWLKTQTTLVVSFGDDKVYEYETEIAPLIAQQLNTRVQVRSALDKAETNMITGKESVSNFSNSTAALVSSIEGGNSSSGSSSIISFARTISEAFLNDRECTERGSSMWHRDTNGIVNDAALALRLIHLIPDSPEMLISAAIQDIMFDVRTPEGNTRRVFVQKVLAYSTEGPDAVDSKVLCTELRHFIDGMHEYIMEKRGASLSAIFVVASSGSEKRKLNFRVAKAHETDSGPERSSEIQYQHPKIDNSGAHWWKHHNELTILSLSYLVFTGVEQSVCITLQEKLDAALPSSVNKDKDLLLLKKMRYFKNRSQCDWDIPDEFRSQSNWESATFELAGIERNPTPSMKIYALLQCAKAIYSEFKSDILPRLMAKNPKKTDIAIGADDFLPIFLYVLCQSTIETPLVTKEVLWGLCHPDQLYGESGYYLTVYESALDFIENIEIDSDLWEAHQGDNFEECPSRRTISVTQAGDMASILSPAAQIKKKIRRMSVNVIERVKTRTNSVDTDSSPSSHLSRSGSSPNFAKSAVTNPIQPESS